MAFRVAISLVMLRVASANLGFTTTVSTYGSGFSNGDDATGIAFYNPQPNSGLPNLEPLIFLSSAGALYSGKVALSAEFDSIQNLDLKDGEYITSVVASNGAVFYSTQNRVLFRSTEKSSLKSIGQFGDKIQNPTGMFIASNGDFFVVDGKQGDVLKTSFPLLKDLKSLKIDPLDKPTAVAYDPTKSALYVVVNDGRRVFKVVGDSKKSIGRKSKDGTCADGSAEAATFGSVTGITVDKRGNVFLVDAECYIVRFIDNEGYVTTVAGDGKNRRADGEGTTASFLNPVGISYDSKNDILYVLERQGSIRTVNIGGPTFAPQYVCGEVQPPRPTAWWWGDSMWAKRGTGKVARKHVLQQLAKENAYASVWKSMIGLYQNNQTYTADGKVVLGSKAAPLCPALEYGLLVETVVQFVYENIGDGFSPGVFRETFFNTLEESTARLVGQVGNTESIKRKVVVKDADGRSSSEPLDGMLNGKVAFQVRGPNGMRLRDKMQFASLMKRYNFNPTNKLQPALIGGFFISVEREGVAVYYVPVYRRLSDAELQPAILSTPDYSYTCGSVGARPKGWWTHTLSLTVDTTVTTDIPNDNDVGASPFVTQFQTRPSGFCPNVEYRALVTSVAEFVFRQQAGAESSLGAFKENFMIALNKTISPRRQSGHMDVKKDVVFENLKLSVTLGKVMADLIIEDEALVLFRSSGGVRLSDRRLAGNLAHLYATSPGAARGHQADMGYNTAFVVVLEAEGVSVYDAVAPTVAVKQQRLRFEAGPRFRKHSTVILPTSSDADAKRVWRQFESYNGPTDSFDTLGKLANDPAYNINLESSASTEQPVRGESTV